MMLTCGNGLDVARNLAEFRLKQPRSLEVDVSCSEGCKDEAFSEDLVRRVTAIAAAGLAQFAGLRAFVQTCRVCGCTDAHACAGGCSWATPSLCSACAKKPAQAAGAAQ
jgi:hypothetical protein